MAITKASPTKKTTAPAKAEKPAISKPATASKTASAAATEKPVTAKPATASETAAEKPVTAKPATTEKAASKTAADRQIRLEDSAKAPVTTSEIPQPGRISPELRLRMIRDAAYFRAERRGFAKGDPARDWMEAEAEIDRMLREEQKSTTRK